MMLHILITVLHLCIASGNTTVQAASMQTGPYNSEIPITWNQYTQTSKVKNMIPATLWNATITYSIAANSITFTDSNAEQINIYEISPREYIQIQRNFRREIKMYKTSGRWSQKTVSGIPTNVYTYSTETDGTISKARSGGQIWFINTSQTRSTADEVIIHKQAKGDREFESNFLHFIQTIRL